MLRVLLTALAVLALALAVPAAADASRMPAPPHAVIHENTPCPAYADGGSCSYAETDDVFLEPGATAFDRQHELGHQFDRQVLTGPDRGWFTARLGFPAGTSWAGGEAFYTSANLSKTLPAEKFADAYAACALGKSPGNKRHDKWIVAGWETAYDYYPTARQYRAVCNAIVVIGLVRTGSEA